MAQVTARALGRSSLYGLVAQIWRIGSRLVLTPPDHCPDQAGGLRRLVTAVLPLRLRHRRRQDLQHGLQQIRRRIRRQARLGRVVAHHLVRRHADFGHLGHGAVSPVGVPRPNLARRGCSRSPPERLRTGAADRVRGRLSENVGREACFRCWRGCSAWTCSTRC